MHTMVFIQTSWQLYLCLSKMTPVLHVDTYHQSIRSKEGTQYSELGPECRGIHDFEDEVHISYLVNDY